MPDPLPRAALAFLLFLVAALSFPVATHAQSGCVDGGRLTPVSESDGIGGTGLKPNDPNDPDEGGIGGTGHSSGDPEEGGIGGTGIRAEGDAGVIGTITGFGSICVGGTEIHYDADTPVVRDGAAVSTATLAVGQVVEVVAEDSGEELNALSIGIRRTLRGPIEKVDPEQNRFIALGQIVQLDEVAWTGSPSHPLVASLADIHQGDFVEVSGLRRPDGIIVASRITPASADDGVFLSGLVSRVDDEGISVGATRVRVPTEARPRVANGDQVDVSGRWTGSSMLATSVAVSPSVPFGGRVKRIEIEGYVHERISERELRVGAYRIELSDQGDRDDVARAALESGEPIRVEAVVGPDRGLVRGRLFHLPNAPRGSDRARQPGRFNPPADNDPKRPPQDGRRRADPRNGAAAAAPLRPESLTAGDAGRPDRPARPVVPDRPQRPQRPERPAPPERPERPDRPQRPERPQRPVRPDRPPGR